MIDEDKTQLELYKRALELAKSTFGLAEGAIKTIEEKGRNNITLATTMLGFVILVLRPDTVVAKFGLGLFYFQLLSLAMFVFSVLNVIFIYNNYIVIIRPVSADQIDPQWIVDLPDSVGKEVESVASELGIYKRYIEQSQEAMKVKSRALKSQTNRMVALVVFVVLYLVCGGVHLALQI
jgi:hypothetical protein